MAVMTCSMSFASCLLVGHHNDFEVAIGLAIGLAEGMDGIIVATSASGRQAARTCLDGVGKYAKAIDKALPGQYTR
jgi:hypothetical protein